VAEIRPAKIRADKIGRFQSGSVELCVLERGFRSVEFAQIAVHEVGAQSFGPDKDRTGEVRVQEIGFIEDGVIENSHRELRRVQIRLDQSGLF
jgi:hypothetical protein